jgi:uncharacterized phage protein (TIGR02218 family)
MSNLRVPVNFTGGYTVADLVAHMAQAVTTLCVCAHIVSPIDATEIGITSLDTDLTGVPGYSGVTFRSTTGVVASKIEHPGGISPSNMEADFFLVALGLTEADVLAGKWTHARATVFETNYEALNMGQMIINDGYLGEFTQRGQVITTEIRGRNQALAQIIGKITRAECDADFGDARCGLDLSALGFIKTGTLTGVTSQSVFTDSGRSEAANYFDNGKFKFTSGSNNGYEFQIDNWNSSTKTFTLRTSAPYTPAIGNTYQAIRGCRKRFEADCVGTFNNGINNRSFPFIPTAENMIRLPLV